MNVDLIDHMGSDLTVVNAARVSMAKESAWVWDCQYCGDDPENRCWQFDAVCGYNGKPLVGKNVLSEKDAKLIAYLATHGHWTPFSHPQITLRVKAPLFVARQLFKHKQGLTENEVSRRYVDDEPEFYTPAVWRAKAENVKQGSSDDPVELWSMWDFDTGEEDIAAHYSDSYRLYQHLLDQGVAPEQARMVLPQSMYTEWYWTGSLAAFARVCKLRLDSHAQSETREVAQMISNIIEPLYPVSWKALTA